ncbi:MAG: two-component sensor histidine kinase [Deltaproteobacteria bacterium]|nr:two-component sensor histidine kinase [Deltaproteobacteria bacterium]
MLFIKNRIGTVLIFSVMPLILVSGIILYQFKASHYEKIHAHLGTLVKKHKQNIDSFLNEKLGDIHFIAEIYSFHELGNETFLKEKLETLQQAYGPVFVDLGVVNSHGVQVAYAGPFKLGKAVYSDADWFKEAMKREYVISDVFLGLRGLPHFIVAVRKSVNGDQWVLRATIDFAAFNDLVENIRIGETGFAFILNKEGDFQTKPLMDVIPEKGPYMDLLESDTKEEVQIVEKEDELSGNNIYVSAFLKNGDWLLVYQQKASDAFSAFTKALRVSVIIIILGSIGTIALAFVRFKNMAHHMEKAEHERRLMNEQIIETGKLAVVGELAAGVAHEINNPVAIMVEEAGWIEDLLEEEEFKESENIAEFRRALKQINTQGKRCKEITQKLLSFARKTDSKIQEVQINELIEEIITLSAQRAKFSNVTIGCQLQDGLPVIQGAHTELQQVLLNLINNALDAMEKGGGTIDIKTRLNKDHIVVEIADNGPGIASANLKRIFEPFFTTKPVGKGTGLGLSICYGIMKRLGGDIEVQSVIDKGTIFRINIPLKKYIGEKQDLIM